MPIRLAIIDDYEVVVRGLAHMVTSFSDDFVAAELDSRVPVEEEVDIALYDTFAQNQAGGPQVAELIENPRVHKVVVYSWNLEQHLVDAAVEQAGMFVGGQHAAQLDGERGIFGTELRQARLARGAVEVEQLVQQCGKFLPALSHRGPRRGRGWHAGWRAPCASRA